MLAARKLITTYNFNNFDRLIINLQDITFYKLTLPADCISTTVLSFSRATNSVSLLGMTKMVSVIKV